MEQARLHPISEDEPIPLKENDSPKDASPKLRDFMDAVCGIFDIPAKSGEIAGWIDREGIALFREILEALEDGTLKKELGLESCMHSNQLRDVTLRLQEKKEEEDQKEKAYLESFVLKRANAVYYTPDTPEAGTLVSGDGYYAKKAAAEAAAKEAEEAPAEEAPAKIPLRRALSTIH